MLLSVQIAMIFFNVFLHMLCLHHNQVVEHIEHAKASLVPLPSLFPCLANRLLFATLDIIFISGIVDTFSLWSNITFQIPVMTCNNTSVNTPLLLIVWWHSTTWIHHSLFVYILVIIWVTRVTYGLSCCHHS